MSSKYISIGKILNFHGIKGEAKVGYTKGNEAFLASLKCVSVNNGKEFIVLHIESLRFHKQFALIKFKELNTVNDVQELKGQNIYSLRELAQKALKEDEYLFADLEGSKVYNQYDDYVGVVEKIGETSASNILAVKSESGKTHLIPFVKELVPVVDIANKKILINQIEGLIDD